MEAHKDAYLVHVGVSKNVKDAAEREIGNRDAKREEAKRQRIK